MSNILITSAGRRVELVNSFKTECAKLNKKFKVFCTQKFLKLIVDFLALRLQS